ncbi:T9SS type A sorting domain-containing protein, partial [bacterium]|nr:T9SS type A sorting domain-containing protein [bacterium]
QNYPNPFNPTTMIPFDLPERSHVRLSISNVLGQEIREIARGEYGAGHHEVMLDAASLAAGVYFYQIETEHYTAVRKLAVVK